MDKKSPLLEVIDLNIEFHDHLVPETVVYDFDLTLNEGEIVGIVGESGSGKSMTALAIAGLLSRHDMEKKGRFSMKGWICSLVREHSFVSFRARKSVWFFRSP